MAVGRSNSRACWLASELAELRVDNQAMDVASDQEPAPLSKPVHAVFTIEQVWPHFDALMAEELPAQDDLCCNLRLLNEHRLVEGRIADEQANDNAVSDMWPYDPGFLNEQQALYQTICRAREALSVVLRVVAFAVAPPSRVVNMVNEQEESGDDFN